MAEISILELLLPDLDYTQLLHIDQLHPALSFRQNRLEAIGDLKSDLPVSERRDGR